jgi:hypothetical protein
MFASIAMPVVYVVDNQYPGIACHVGMFISGQAGVRRRTEPAPDLF